MNEHERVRSLEALQHTCSLLRLQCDEFEQKLEVEIAQLLSEYAEKAKARGRE